MISKISPREFDFVVNRLRGFCRERGLFEVHTGNILSILAACEDPTTIGQFTYAGDVWPLPQTGQMHLEKELLEDPTLPGVFCVSTSYRQEPEPVPGRHDLIFPMFEFELRGGMDVLEEFERDLLEHLGFGESSAFPSGNYLDTAHRFGAKLIDAQVEEEIGREFGPVFFLKHFPDNTSPFWNMRRDGHLARKIDVILHGIETVGSAERSCDPAEMHYHFETISDGSYAKLLFGQFRRERVLRELDEFLSHSFFPRSGGGIGMTRIIRALRLSGLIKEGEKKAAVDILTSARV
ncbi:MAG: aspartyl-tRNA synthetase [Parcubacteria group bacterium Gr01-1014_107]|nr:MAG: aspartyl-tRNA synthetase [Parcubacteria group bacterium Gr01-1014_107]